MVDKMMDVISSEKRVLGGLWGSLVGDALGVPVEFMDRGIVQANPVRGMRGQGVHHQPAGTWSDDGSLILCTVDSLINSKFDTQDMGSRFVDWMYRGLWTAWGEPFDVGIATSDSLIRIANGIPAEEAGGKDEFNNGNGSLMRILPIVLRFAADPMEEFSHKIYRASAITHRHERSKMACVLYGMVVRHLLFGLSPKESVEIARSEFSGLYAGSHSFERFGDLLRDDFSSLPQEKVHSTGYVLYTLHASLWCLLTTSGYKECVLKAVNLGEDSDTTGCVAGGLAGVAYGLDSVPVEWIVQMARKPELDALFKCFASRCAEFSMKSGSS